MPHWRDQLNSLGSTAFQLVERVSSELTAETETDPLTELQYHKEQAIKLERDLVKCQSELSAKTKEAEALSDSVREAFEEVEVTRQSLLNRLAAKELELDKARHQIEQLKDFQYESNFEDNADNNQLALELDILRAEKANLSDELTALTTKLQYYQTQLAAKSTESLNESSQLKPHELEVLQEELTKSNNRVEHLRQEMSTLLEKNHLLLDECTERQRNCQELEHKLTSIQSINSSAHSSELEKLRSKVQELQQKLDESNNESLNELDKLRNENKELKTALIESETSFNEISLEHQRLIKDSAENEKSTNERIKQVEMELQNKQELIEASEESNKSIIEKLNRSISQLKEDLDLLQDKNNTAEENLQLLETENDQLKSQHVIEIEHLNVKLDELKVKNSELAERNADDEIEKLKAENIELIEKLEEKDVEKSQNLYELEQLNIKIDELKAENIELIEKLEEKDRDKNTSIDDTAIEHFRCEIEELRSENTRIAQRNKILQDEINSSIKRCENEDGKNEELTIRLNKLETDLERKDQLIMELEKKAFNSNESAHQQIDRLSAQISELEGINDQLRSEHLAEIKELTNKLETMEFDVTEKQRLIREFEEKTEDDKSLVDQTVLQLKQEIEQLKHENMDAIQSVHSQRDENERLKATLIEMEVALNQMATEREQLIDSNKESANAEVAALEIEKQQLIRNFEESQQIDRTNFDQIISQLNQQIETLNQQTEHLKASHVDQINELNMRVQNLTTELESNRKLVESSEEVANSSKQMFDELNRNVVHLNKQVALLRDENDRLKVALTESETSLDELMNERKNLVEGTTEAEIYRMHTQDRIERKQQELEEALNKVRQKEDEIDFYRLSLDKKQQENEHLQKRINSINATIKDLQSTYAETQAQLRNAEKTSTQTDCELRQTIQRLELEKNEINKQNADTNEKLKLVESQVLDLRAEIELLEEKCQKESLHQNGSSSNPSTSTNLATFVIPPELRQFIISAITCDEQKRADGALLLASLIGCTPDERLKVEESYRSHGWTSIFRSPQASSSRHPRNTREFMTQFVDFLERESSMANAANIEKTEPVRLEHDIQIQPQNNSSDRDLNDILSQ